MPVTYQTKIKDHPYLNEYADLFGRLERQLFVDHYINNKKLVELKTLYISNNQITARQFNAIQYNLKGKILSLEEVRKERIETIKGQIKSTGKWITSKEKQRAKLAKKLLKLKPNDEKYIETINKYRHLKFVLHQKKRRLRNLEHKLTKLQGDQENNIIRICFGSRKFFKAQHNLKENGYTNHTDWLKDWRISRNSQFYIIGSKDETMGNQTCTYNLNNALRLRVADCFEKEFGKYITFQEVNFPYGQEVLDQSREVVRTKDKKGKPKKESKSAISYRFIRKGKAWYIHANTNPEYPVVTTNRWNGAIGIDLVRPSKVA